MDVVGHDDGGVECVPLTVAVETVLENQVTGMGGECTESELAESYEYGNTMLLIVRQTSMIGVLPVELRGHGRVPCLVVYRVGCVSSWLCTELVVYRVVVYRGHSCPRKAGSGGYFRGFSKALSVTWGVI